MTANVAVHQPAELLASLEEIEARLKTSSHVGLFVDFDGTIASIVDTPADATIDRGIKQTLTALVARPDFTVAIVSGRALEDVRERVGLADAVYVGNHGFEIEANGTHFREPHAEALRRELKSLYLQLKLALSETEGIEIENKGLTLSVHFRRVAEHFHDWVRSVSSGTVSRSRSFDCQEGNMVLEVKPHVEWHKGYAIRWIAREILPYSALPIYLGSDSTDEVAFGVISEGITIRVGGSDDSAANYALPDVASVRRFLEWLDHAKPHASIAHSQRAGR